MVKIKRSVKSKSSAKLPLVVRLVMVFSVCFGFAAAITLIINLGMVFAARKYVYSSVDALPSRTAVLVLGSQTRGTRLSPVLQDRVEGGIKIMERGKGKKIILSGDHGQLYYDEVTAMKLYVEANAPSIHPMDIFLDHAGFSTWDSMYRARDVFEVKDLLIVTQDFHIARAVCMARSLGMDAVGYGVNQERFAGRGLRRWQFREYFARVKAFYSIMVKPKPRYLGDKIPITGDGRATQI